MYQVIQHALSEDGILAATLPAISAEEIIRGMEARSECCVVHLCGCGR